MADKKSTHAVDALADALLQFRGGARSAHVAEVQARDDARRAAEKALLDGRRSRLSELHPDKLGREQTAEEREEYMLLNEQRVPLNSPARVKHADLLALLERQRVQQRHANESARRSAAAKKAAATRKARQAAKPEPVTPAVEPVTEPKLDPVTPAVTRACPHCGGAVVLP